MELESNEQEMQQKLLRVKSNPNDGNLCRNCHMRLGHTARSCEYEKCESVFSCGEEKLHPGKIDSRSMRCSIKKKKATISKLERELTHKGHVKTTERNAVSKNRKRPNGRKQ